MDIKTGTLYGLGVGPGDPELITLKSMQILNKVDIVFAASSTKNNYSLAVSIAKPHIPEATLIKMLAFPMIKDISKAKKIWEEHAHSIIKELVNGKDVAFVTLGDCMTYSTYGYILKHISMLAPDISIVSVPGITSYQAAAARINKPLVEGEESLTIVSGIEGGNALRELKSRQSNMVFLKAYKNINDIVSAIEEADLLDTSVGITNCGLAEEKIIKDVKSFTQMPPEYWTLIMTKPKKENGA